MSKDLRREAKKKRRARARKLARRGPPKKEIKPYTGTKYRSADWAPHVKQTETAVYETILDSEYNLTNEEVETAFVRLAQQLHAGRSPLLEDGDPVTMEYSPEIAVDYLIWNIRRHWEFLFARSGDVATADLIGILRALLYSIKAHAWHNGKDKGYVDFLRGFLTKSTCE